MLFEREFFPLGKSWFALLFTVKHIFLKIKSGRCEKAADQEEKT
jgi:hypothetical protein